ncbi:hypothetical protein WI76_07145 [Burkholderia ubonensis]|uniref:hypothetical protein n=1 Tax=Burkholderia ubonensis TaxID=101571 RepID=UPI00075DC522|nr:hypothetical protein [Burkholderia ubonensis]KVC84524.1 hypothetical protein WI76_07145 [Burkholderia ubonensis]
MRNLPVRLLGILLVLHLSVAHAQPAGAPDDAIGAWHFDDPLLYYGDMDTDGNVLYVICEAGRLRASVLVNGADRHDGQRVRVTFASNGARVSSRGALAPSDLDMYAVAEITDRARFYRLFDDDRELRIDVEGEGDPLRLPLRGARDQAARLKAACPVRQGR